MRNSYSIQIGLICVVFLSCCVVGAFAEPRAPQEKFRLGFIASLSGDLEVYGDSARKGFELALEEIGRDWIEVYYEDDKFESARTVTAFKKLIDINKVNAVVTVGSNPSSAVAPLALSRDVPLLAWASDNRMSTHNPAVLRTYPSGTTEGDVLAHFAVSRGVNKLAVLISHNAYAQSWKSGIDAGFGPDGIVFNEEVLSEGDDFRSLIARAQRRGAQSYAVCLDVGKIAAFTRQLRELGETGSIIGCEYLNSREEVTASQGALIGAWFSTARVTDSFRDKVKSTYPADGVISGVANHYDLAYLLHRAWQAGATARLIPYLRELGPQQGAVGKFEIVNRNEETFFDLPLEIREVTEEGYKSVG